MRRPAVALLAAAGRGRTVLVAVVTAAVTALLLVAATIVRLDPYDTFGSTVYGDDHFVGVGGDPHVIAPLTDPGTRLGAVFAVVLMTVPLFLLLAQAVRLGSTDRGRRYAALQVAGATRKDCRRWGALEVAGPSAVGVVLGFGLWALLRRLLGWPHLAIDGTHGLVPTQVGPGPWAVIIVAVILGYAVWVGARSGNRSAEAWMTLRSTPRPPSLWNLAILVGGLAAMSVIFVGVPAWLLRVDTQLVTIPFIVVVIVGMALAAPWFAWQIASRVASRTSRVERLLAARRLAADPRPASRAAAASGAAALAATIAAVIAADLLRNGGSDSDALAATAVCGVGILLALATIAVTIAVRSVEAIAERHREMATLVATGVPAPTVLASLGTEARMVAMPVTLIGAGLGVAFGAVVGSSGGDVLMSLAAPAAGVVTVLLALGALELAERLTRSVARAALEPANLRTE